MFCVYNEIFGHLGQDLANLVHDLCSETTKEDLLDQSLYASEPITEEIDFAEAV